MAVSRKGIHIDFDRLAQAGYADPLFPVTRASAGTVQDMNGYLSTVAANLPRYTRADADNYKIKKALLIEEQRTNLCAVNSSQYNETGVSTNGFADPASGTLAQRHVQTGYGRVGQDFSAMPASTFTFSIWLKGGTGGETIWLRAYRNNDLDVISQSFVLTNGWKRYQMAAAWANAGFNRVSVAASAGVTFYTYGWQAEVGVFATSYIPTISASVARSVDSVAVVDNAQRAIGLRNDTGTVVCDFTPLTGSGRVDGTRYNEVYFMAVPAGGDMWSPGIKLWCWAGEDGLYLTIGASTRNDVLDTRLLTGMDGRKRVVFSWDANRKLQVAINGTALMTDFDMSNLPAAMDRVGIGNQAGNGYTANALFHEVRYIPDAYPSAWVTSLSKLSKNPL